MVFWRAVAPGHSAESSAPWSAAGSTWSGETTSQVCSIVHAEMSRRPKHRVDCDSMAMACLWIPSDLAPDSEMISSPHSKIMSPPVPR